MPAPLIITHRGASFDAPENTLAAFRLAWQQNADGAEGDFQLTCDGQIICMHDLTTGRTASADRVVSQSTFDELRKLDVGIWKHPRFTSEPIPTLDEILALLPPRKLFFIEIKCGPEILPPIREAIARSNASTDQLRILCFDAAVIATAREMLPAIRAHWLVDYSIVPATNAKTPTPQAILKTLREISASGFNSHADTAVLTAKFVTELHAAGFEVAAWTVDDPSLAGQLTRAGVEFITTNRPGWLREQLRA